VLCTVLALAVLALEGPVHRMADRRRRDNASDD
jgi:hypothetical protein